MKTFYILILSIFSLSPVFAQIGGLDTCSKKKLLPYQGETVINTNIDTISADSFGKIVNLIHFKLKEQDSLTYYEITYLIKILNTVCWIALDSQLSLNNKFPKIENIELMYNDSYFKVLRCRYSVWIGKGMSIYYKDFDLNYGGTPGICSRYRVLY